MINLEKDLRTTMTARAARTEPAPLAAALCAVDDRLRSRRRTRRFTTGALGVAAAAVLIAAVVQMPADETPVASGPPPTLPSSAAYPNAAALGLPEVRIDDPAWRLVAGEATPAGQSSGVPMYVHLPGESLTSFASIWWEPEVESVGEPAGGEVAAPQPGSRPILDWEGQVAEAMPYKGGGTAVDWVFDDGSVAHITSVGLNDDQLVDLILGLRRPDDGLPGLESGDDVRMVPVQGREGSMYFVQWLQGEDGADGSRSVYVGVSSGGPLAFLQQSLDLVAPSGGAEVDVAGGRGVLVQAQNGDWYAFVPVTDDAFAEVIIRGLDDRADVLDLLDRLTTAPVG
ncbi:MAG: hypothetical protein JJE52_08310 [Acidimicrobiia bacterium]|nr:hypothetical protein [Acidimicrobiia bacterium]